MFDQYQRNPRCATIKLKLQCSRRALHQAIRKANDDWIIMQTDRVNDGVCCGATGSWIQSGMGCRQTLKRGLELKRRPAPIRMKSLDSSSASTAEDNAEVFARHFDGSYGCRAVYLYDDSVLLSLPERAHAEGLEGAPTDSEISLAISKLHDSALGASGSRASAWKALADDRTTFADLIRTFVIEFWESEVLPCSWEVGLLSILPKKGDLSLPGNYRGIMMLEVDYKIIGHILLARLKVIKENAKHLDHEAQCGFRNGRGCTDSTFTVKSLMTKRREHNQETWILFLDLVKAFDKVFQSTSRTPLASSHQIANRCSRQVGFNS